jgi:hypothetical protein
MWDVEAPTFSRQSAHRLWWGCQPYAPAALYTKEDSWYSLLLEAESTQGHSAAGKIRPIEKSSDIIGTRTRDLPACSIVPQPTTLPRAPIYINSLHMSLKNFCCISKVCIRNKLLLNLWKQSSRQSRTLRLRLRAVRVMKRRAAGYKSVCIQEVLRPTNSINDFRSFPRS